MRCSPGDAHAAVMQDASVEPGGAVRLRLQFLGNGEASVDGRRVSFRTRKTFALLSYLIVNHGLHPREKIAELLWPDADGATSRESLRTGLTYLRHALGDAAGAVLISTRDMIGISAEAAEADVDRVHEASTLARLGRDPRLRHQIRAATDCYHGPFLHGLSLPDAPEFETWLYAQRAYWRGVVAELLSLLATMQEEAGEVSDAIRSLEQWTTIEPDDELAWRRLIELHLRQGNPAGAHGAWEQYRLTLGQLEVAPSRVMRELSQRIAGSSFPGLRARPGLSDLDLQQAPFVGRPKEWAKLQAAYQRVQTGHSEIAIIAGQPGVGKTRLATEFGSSVSAAGADLMTGRGLEGVGGLPYAPIVDALRGRLEAENAPEDLVSDLWLAELARLLPELLERYPDLAVRPEDRLTRSRTFEAVSRLGIALGRRKPVVMLIDDAQWAGRESFDLLRYAIRRWSETGTPVLVVLVAETPLHPEVDHWLRALAAEARTTWMEITALPPADVTRLVAMLSGSNGATTETTDRFGRWLADQTGGRPRGVIETLRDMLEQGRLGLRALNESRWAIDLPADLAFAEPAFGRG